jgi:hypothetical protein
MQDSQKDLSALHQRFLAGLECAQAIAAKAAKSKTAKKPMRSTQRYTVLSRRNAARQLLKIRRIFAHMLSIS